MQVTVNLDRVETERGIQMQGGVPEVPFNGPTCLIRVTALVVLFLYRGHFVDILCSEALDSWKMGNYYNHALPFLHVDNCFGGHLERPFSSKYTFGE